MRTTTATIDTAINNPDGIYPLIRATVNRNRIAMSSLDDHSFSGATSYGDIPQCLVVHPTSGKLISFYNYANILNYTIEGDFTKYATSYGAPSGSPSVFTSGSIGYLYHFDTNQAIIYKRTINWTSITAGSATPFSSSTTISNTLPFSSYIYLVAVGLDKLAVFHIDSNNNGLPIVSYYNGSTWATSTKSFICGTTKNWDHVTDTEYDWPGPSICIDRSTAFILNDVVYFYVTSPDGSVHCQSYDPALQVWSDSIQVIQFNKRFSLCSFRATDSYVSGGNGFLVGEMTREQTKLPSLLYTLVLKTTNGKNFIIDAASLVSTKEYRFRATTGNGKLYLSYCNRVLSGYLTSRYGTPHSSQSFTISGDDIAKFTGSTDAAKLLLVAGQFPYKDLVRTGDQIIVDVGYKTTAGDEYVTYGTYLVQSPTKMIGPGQADHEIALVNESMWRMQSGNWPFYAEFIGRSTISANINKTGGDMYPLANLSRAESGPRSADFFGGAAWSANGALTECTTFLEKGGVTSFTLTNDGNWYGIRSREAKVLFGLADNPYFAVTSVSGKIEGWARGSLPAIAKAFVVYEGLEDQSPVFGDEVYFLDSTQSSLSFTIPVIRYLPVKYFGLAFKARASGTVFCPSAVTFTSGLICRYTAPSLQWITDDDKNVEGMRIPGHNNPYIMLSQKPYDPVDFQLFGRFKYTYNFSTYPGTPMNCFVGFVGFCTDHLNYIAMVIDIPGSYAYIFRTKDGVDSTLASASYAVSITRGSSFDLMCTHKNGVITLAIIVAGTATNLVSYAWKSTDGYMLRDVAIPGKVGVCGFVQTPAVRTTGYKIGAVERDESEYQYCDGLPILPEYTTALSTFPSSGKLKIQDAIYTYSSKIAISNPRGPYQFRQRGEYKKKYGAEIKYYDPSLLTSAYAGKLFAMDDGYAYLITSSYWSMTDRSRHYSANANLASDWHGLENRVYITGGFGGVSQDVSEQTSHSFGELVSLHLDGELYCERFKASSGGRDYSISFLLDEINVMAGGSIVYPNDVVVASPTISTNYSLGDYQEAYDISLEVSRLTFFGVAFNFSAWDRFTMRSITNARIIFLNVSGSTWAVTLSDNATGTEIARALFTAPVDLGTKYHSVRIMICNRYASVILDDVWIATFCFTFEIPTTDGAMWLLSGATYRNLRVREISDWREAIYIDFESSGQSAMQSILQERSVFTAGNSDGSLAVWYNFDYSRGAIVSTNQPRKHKMLENPQTAISDALVYAGEAFTLQYQDLAEAYGLSTRVIRVSSLDTGAVKAAHEIVRRMTASKKIDTIETRLDVRIETGDTLNIVYDSPDAGSVNRTIKVTSCSINISPPGASSIVEGYAT